MEETRFSYLEHVTVKEWEQNREHVTNRFRITLAQSCASNGYPPPPEGATPRVTGLRPNTERVLNKWGKLTANVECDPNDPRATQIQLSMPFTLATTMTW